jgi:hypothetical protein
VGRSKYIVELIQETKKVILCNKAYVMLHPRGAKECYL